MLFGYRAGVALTSLVLAATLPAAAVQAPRPPCAALHLYSPRALHRLRILLAIRLLELREAHLALAAEAVRRKLAVDELLRETSQPRRVDQAAKLKQNGCLHATP